jgi:hypothetical protein
MITITHQFKTEIIRLKILINNDYKKKMKSVIKQSVTRYIIDYIVRHVGNKYYVKWVDYAYRHTLETEFARFWLWLSVI